MTFFISTLRKVRRTLVPGTIFSYAYPRDAAPELQRPGEELRVVERLDHATPDHFRGISRSYTADLGQRDLNSLVFVYWEPESEYEKYGEVTP